MRSHLKCCVKCTDQPKIRRTIRNICHQPKLLLKFEFRMRYQISVIRIVGLSTNVQYVHQPFKPKDINSEHSHNTSTSNERNLKWILFVFCFHPPHSALSPNVCLQNLEPNQTIHSFHSSQTASMAIHFHDNIFIYFSYRHHEKRPALGLLDLIAFCLVGWLVSLVSLV